MIKYYTNRELSSIFNVNLAKWKRWSREFLPPDPLGGKQSGYARQYHTDQAFAVFLGGHMVSDLKFSIPEAKQILIDLKPWLVKTGFYRFSASHKKKSSPLMDSIREYKIYIRENKNPEDTETSFHYIAHGRISVKTHNLQGQEVYQEQYIRKTIAHKGGKEIPGRLKFERLLNMTGVLIFFIQRLYLDHNDYSALAGYKAV